MLKINSCDFFFTFIFHFVFPKSLLTFQWNVSKRQAGAQDPRMSREFDIGPKQIVDIPGSMAQKAVSAACFWDLRAVSCESFTGALQNA